MTLIDSILKYLYDDQEFSLSGNKGFFTFKDKEYPDSLLNKHFSKIKVLHKDDLIELIESEISLLTSSKEAFIREKLTRIMHELDKSNLEYHLVEIFNDNWRATHSGQSIVAYDEEDAIDVLDRAVNQNKEFHLLDIRTHFVEYLNAYRDNELPDEIKGLVKKEYPQATLKYDIGPQVKESSLR